jgi:hypothetical protein
MLSTSTATRVVITISLVALLSFVVCFQMGRELKSVFSLDSINNGAGEQGFANTLKDETEIHDTQTAGANPQSIGSSTDAIIETTFHNVGIDESGKTKQKAEGVLAADYGNVGQVKKEQLQLPSVKNGGLVIFLHIPKTGGSSIAASLSRHPAVTYPQKSTGPELWWKQHEKTVITWLNATSSTATILEGFHQGNVHVLEIHSYIQRSKVLLVS